MKSTVRIRMDDYEERKNFIVSLVNNGHKIWVEQCKILQTIHYTVCFEINTSNITTPNDMEIGI